MIYFTYDPQTLKPPIPIAIGIGGLGVTNLNIKKV